MYCDITIGCTFGAVWPDDRLCFQYLVIFSNEILPKSIQIVPKWVENFAQNQINLEYIAKYFFYWTKWWNFAKSGHTALVPHHDALWHYQMELMYCYQLEALWCITPDRMYYDVTNNMFCTIMLRGILASQSNDLSGHINLRTWCYNRMHKDIKTHQDFCCQHICYG